MVTEHKRPARSRAAEAFRALDSGSELAKRRVWRRVEAVVADDRRRRSRRLGLMAGIAASAVAALAIAAPAALDAARSWYEPSQQEQQRVAVSAVMEMLGAQAAGGNDANATDSDNVEQFAQYLVTSVEAKTGAE